MAETAATTTIAPTAASADPASAPEKAFQGLTFFLKVWPPTQRTREAVVRRLVETFTTRSVLSDRYGLLSEEEANDASRRIEEEAYDAATSAAGESDAGSDEIEVLRAYSQEVSRRMLASVKSRVQ